MSSLRTTTADVSAATSSDRLTRLGGSCFIGAFNKGIADELQEKIRTGGRLSGFSPSPQQLQVFDWGKTGTGSLLVIARAGCGKTTTALELAQLVSPSPVASTLHSLGLRLWNSLRNTADRREFPSTRSQVDSSKVRGLTYAIWPYDKNRPENKDIARVLIQLVSFAKGQGFGVPGCPDIDDHAAWAEIIDFNDMLDEIPDVLPSSIPGEGVVASQKRLIDDATDIYRHSLELCKTQNKIDYDDMILAPLYFGPKTYTKRPELYDWVMLDEGQDTSWTRFLLCRYVLKTGGRMVVIGDPAQSINLFAGATCDALAVIQQELAASSLPLSITYRCPRVVVEHAKQWVPEFEAHESAPEGIHRSIPHTQFWLQQFDSANDVILCRLNRPLAGIASRLRAMGINCVVEGQSAKGLIRLATKWGKTSVKELLENLQQYVTVESERWEARGRLDKAERLQDRVGTVIEIATEAGVATTDDVVFVLEKNFGEGQYAVNALHLCSIHKAKGREWKRVFVIGRDRYMPSPWAKKPEEIQQEENLQYVASTRTKHELVEVVVPPKKKKETDWWLF